MVIPCSTDLNLFDDHGFDVEGLFIVSNLSKLFKSSLPIF